MGGTQARSGHGRFVACLAASALLHAGALLLPVPLIHDEVRLPAVLESFTMTLAPGPATDAGDKPGTATAAAGPPASRLAPARPRPPAPARPQAEAADFPLATPGARGGPGAWRTDTPLPSLPAEPGASPAHEPSPVSPAPPTAVPGTAAAPIPGLPSRATAAVTPPSYTADYLRNPLPEYPLSARRLGQEGVVLLRVKVDPAGVPAEVHLAKSSGVASLDEAALKAVRGWTFVPARQGQEPVAAWVEVPIRFRLSDAK